MGVRLVVGRAGTGKSELCLSEIRQELKKDQIGPPLILLVPEQSAFQMEYALVDGQEVEGVARAEVRSFTQLAVRVLKSTAAHSRERVSDIGKRMILRRILQEERDNLLLFREASKKAGFVEKLAAMLSEFAAYNVVPGELGRRIEQEPVLSLKLHDIDLVYRRWRQFLGRWLVDPDDELTLLAEALREGRFLAGATVWIDGFFGFTSSEYEVIGEIIKQAEQVTITLAVDPGLLKRDTVSEFATFYTPWRTYRELRQLMASLGTDVALHILEGDPPARFSASPTLAWLEQSFPDNRQVVPHKAGHGEICLVAAANRRAEVLACARRITALCRDQGYRFRDIAVLMRDIGPYRDLITAAFSDYGIPYFIDQRPDVGHHPLIQALLAVFDIILTNWSYEAVFRLLKTGMTPLAPDEVDRLENYVLAHGIRGRGMWANPFTAKRHLLGRDDQDIEDINETRERAAGLLLVFAEKIRGQQTVEEITTCLYELLVELKVEERMSELVARAEESGDLTLLQEHQQILAGVIELLDELVKRTGSQKMSVREFAEVFRTGLDSLDIGLVPQQLDQVLVGSVDRSRPPRIKACLVLGVSEGFFPKRISEETILSDRERTRLAELGVRLAPTSRERLYREEYLAYRALTRASEYLYLSYPLADSEGRANRPSPVVARLKRILAGLEEQVIGMEPRDESQDLEFVTDRRNTRAGLLVERQRAELENRPLRPVWQAAAKLLGRLLDSRKYKGADLSRDTAERLWGSPIRTSVSRLERFAACPFYHFLADGLKLREQDIFQLDPAGFGIYFHEAMQRLVRRTDFRTAAREDVLKTAGQIAGELSLEIGGEILDDSARHRFIAAFLREVFIKAAAALYEQIKRSSFYPEYVEAEFGMKGDFPALEIRLSGGKKLVVTGRIDRIDVAQTDNCRFVRVIDYKSSAHTLRERDIYNGLSLQLVVYLMAVIKSSEGFVPAGALYFNLKPALVAESRPLSEKELAKERLRSFRMTGLVLDDRDVVRLFDKGGSGHSLLVPMFIKKDGTLGKQSAALTADGFGKLFGFLEKKLQELGERIAGGEIAVKPYRHGTLRACQFCPYHEICQFDVLIPGQSYRYLEEGRIWS